MSIPISGILLDPYGNVARFADIKFVTVQGALDVIQSSSAVFRTDENGAYSIDVQFGRFAVLMRFNGNNGAYEKIQTISVNSDTIATTLGELLEYTEPLTPGEILIVQQLVQQAIDAKDDAEAAALAALLSEQNAAASAAAALASENAAANSVALLAPVPLNGGVWAAGQEFTAYNQYMIFDGEAYSPRQETVLPYFVGATPDLNFVYQIKLNSLQALSGLSEPSDLDGFYRRAATVAQVENGDFPDGSRLLLIDRSNAPFNIEPAGGRLPNGSDILDAGSGNVAVIPKGFVLIEMFGATDTQAFIGAMNAIKDGRQEVVHGTKDRLYDVTITTKQYCSHIEGDGCSIAITNNSSESALTFLGGIKNTFYLNNLNIYTIGNKLDVDSTGNEEFALYDVNDAITLIDDATLTNIEFRALDSVASLDSWFDDINKTRHKGIVRIRAKNSRLENISSYGFGLNFTIYTTDGEIVNHYENNIKGYNCETLLWWRTLGAEPDAKFYSGTSNDLSIINNGAQKNYWISQNQGAQINGKDVILDEADHTYRSKVSNISGSGIIERPMYNQSGTLTIDNVSTDNTGGGSAMLKYDDADPLKFRSNNILRNVAHKGADAATDSQIYGQDNALIDGFNYTRNNRSGRRSIELSRRNKFVTIRNGVVENAAVGLYFASQDAASKQESITVESVTFKNVYAGNAIDAPIVDFRDVAASYTFPTATNLRLANITVDNDEGILSTDLANAAYQFIKIDGIIMDDTQGWFTNVPLTTEGCDNVKVINSYFTQLSPSTISGAISAMKAGSLWQANQFDFVVESRQSTGNYPTSCKMRFKKEADSGAMVDCFPEWVSCEWEQEIPANTTIFENIPLAEYTSRVVATLGDSRLEFYQDGVGLTLTEVSNIGNDLSTTDLNKYRIYNDAGVLRIRTTNATLSGGTLKVVITR